KQATSATDSNFFMVQSFRRIGGNTTTRVSRGRSSTAGFLPNTDSRRLAHDFGGTSFSPVFGASFGASLAGSLGTSFGAPLAASFGVSAGVTGAAGTVGPAFLVVPEWVDAWHPMRPTSTPVMRSFFTVVNP